MSRQFLTQTDHRPWPMPRHPWTMAMRWEDLLFAHWPVAADALRRLLPQGVELDLFDGQAWLGIVPFCMAGTRLRWLPPLPGSSTFPELNVRTYVTHDGKPGVWFFSLDAASPVAVRVARRFFHLPYFDARMSVRTGETGISYQSTRTHRGTPALEFRARYAPWSTPFAARPGTVEHWLTERYCLYSADTSGRIWRGEIHHAPWPLQRTALEIERNTMCEPLGIELPGRPGLMHFARRLDVVAWRICPA